MIIALETERSFEKHLITALGQLCGNRQWTISSHNDGRYQLEWHEHNEDPPIDFDIVHSLALDHEAEYQKLEYQRLRKTQYPSLTDQLDMLWHAIDSGQLDKESAFYKALKQVKDNYPKPQ